MSICVGHTSVVSIEDEKKEQIVHNLMKTDEWRYYVDDGDRRH